MVEGVRGTGALVKGALVKGALVEGVQGTGALVDGSLVEGALVASLPHCVRPLPNGSSVAGGTERRIRFGMRRGVSSVGQRRRSSLTLRLASPSGSS